MAEPLACITKNDVPFVWQESQQQVFYELQRCLQEPPVLVHFDHNAEIEIHTDANSTGQGTVLVQKQNGQERVIAYASGSLVNEVNYSTTEKECLAIVWALSQFRPHIYSRPFSVVTDHHSLCWLMNIKDPAGRLYA